jgi:hypothetical protein
MAPTRPFVFFVGSLDQNVVVHAAMNDRDIEDLPVIEELAELRWRLSRGKACPKPWKAMARWARWVYALIRGSFRK